MIVLIICGLATVGGCIVAGMIEAGEHGGITNTRASSANRYQGTIKTYKQGRKKDIDTACVIREPNRNKAGCMNEIK